MTYFVVENAGYQGERFVYRNKDFMKAFAWMQKQYDAETRDDLHVNIALERKDGSITYEY